jgi:diacylglycerol kinase (ATP)
LRKGVRAELFVNPTAGRGKGSKIYPVVVNKLRQAGIECNVIVSQYPGDITRVSGELAALGHETLIASGGDGTVNEVINGIAGTNAALGIVPLGTANDFAVNMGISKDIDLACSIIKERQIRKIDLVRVNDDKLFGSSGCVGFDAEVAAFASRRRKEGSNPFLLHVLGAILKFFSYEPKTVELRFNGERFFGRVFLVAFGNVRSYAGGMLITPGAVPNDSLLDICVITPMSRWKLLYVFPWVYKGTHMKYKQVTVYRARSVYVQSIGPISLYGDGDFMATTPCRLEVVPKHLNVIVGPDAQAPFSPNPTYGAG